MLVRLCLSPSIKATENYKGLNIPKVTNCVPKQDVSDLQGTTMIKVKNQFVIDTDGVRF